MIRNHVHYRITFVQKNNQEIRAEYNPKQMNIGYLYKYPKLQKEPTRNIKNEKYTIIQCVEIYLSNSVRDILIFVFHQLLLPY